MRTLAASAVALIALVAHACAHCDGLDGPVVQAAQEALETGNLNLVLIWIQKPNEAEIKRAVDQTLAVRSLSGEARELADRFFFETLVRIHRAGEGAVHRFETSPSRPGAGNPRSGQGSMTRIQGNC